MHINKPDQLRDAILKAMDPLSSCFRSWEKWPGTMSFALAVMKALEEFDDLDGVSKPVAKFRLHKNANGGLPVITSWDTVVLKELNSGAHELYVGPVSHAQELVFPQIDEAMVSDVAHAAPQIAAEDAPGLYLESGEFVPADEINSMIALAAAAPSPTDASAVRDQHAFKAWAERENHGALGLPGNLWGATTVREKALMLKAWYAGQSPAAPGAHPAPIDMVLHCPACGLQHIDVPEHRKLGRGVEARCIETWTNPPHRSHLCHGCGHIWRPADVPTNGVQSVKTKGKNDSPAPMLNGLTASEPKADPSEPAPPNSLPDWDECAMRVANSNFIEKRVAEGGYGAGHDSKLATQLHRFIHEYDDADPYRSAWFLHRLELLINEVRAASETAETGIVITGGNIDEFPKRGVDLSSCVATTADTNRMTVLKPGRFSFEAGGVLVTGWEFDCSNFHRADGGAPSQKDMVDCILRYLAGENEGGDLDSVPAATEVRSAQGEVPAGIVGEDKVTAYREGGVFCVTYRSHSHWHAKGAWKSMKQYKELMGIPLAFEPQGIPAGDFENELAETASVAGLTQMTEAQQIEASLAAAGHGVKVLRALPNGDKLPASPSRSQKLSAAGFTARDNRLPCDECGERLSSLGLQVHKCSKGEVPAEPSEGDVIWLLNCSSDPSRPSWKQVPGPGWHGFIDPRVPKKEAVAFHRVTPHARDARLSLTDEQIDRVTDGIDSPSLESMTRPEIRVFARAILAAASSADARDGERKPVVIRCPEKLKNGGSCPHHNLQCGWPACNEEK